jgi:hypothetical protein
MKDVTIEKKFMLGQVVATRGVMEELVKEGVNLFPFLMRHATGDFGDLDAHDRRANQEAIERGFRILSSYEFIHQNDVKKIWIITEADRSSTTILFPDEY